MSDYAARVKEKILSGDCSADKGEKKCLNQFMLKFLK